MHQKDMAMNVLLLYENNEIEKPLEYFQTTKLRTTNFDFEKKILSGTLFLFSYFFFVLLELSVLLIWYTIFFVLGFDCYIVKKSKVENRKHRS